MNYLDKIILASGNAHKASEFQELSPLLNTVLTPAPSTIEVVEDGATYHENALLKARAYSEAFGAPALSDDSGLNVEALPNVLGVLSARFCPELESYKDKCLKVIEMLQKKPRTAHFTCVLCLYIGPKEFYFFEGLLPGEITNALSGEDGFGYDPIFKPRDNDLTLAEDPKWKKAHSHRAKATTELDKFLQKGFVINPKIN